MSIDFARSLRWLLALPAVLPLSATSAATYIAQLDWVNSGSPQQGTSLGSVLIQELSATTLQITVTLNSPETGFVTTGGPHNPFVFNLTGNYGVSVSNSGTQDFTAAAYDANKGYNSTPFGGFTNKIGCCNNANGGANQDPPPLVFTITDANGITAAGLGATFDANGVLTSFGTGDRLGTSTAGYLFSADLVNSSGGTGNVAAKALSVVPSSSVPEPASWLMMVGGFGLAGLTMRGRRRSTHSALKIGRR